MSETLNAGVGSRKSATLKDPANRTVPVMPSSDHPATSEGIQASDCDTYETASAATAVGISTSVTGTTSIFAGSAVSVARWKYIAIGNTNATCMRAEISS